MRYLSSSIYCHLWCGQLSCTGWHVYDGSTFPEGQQDVTYLGSNYLRLNPLSTIYWKDENRPKSQPRSWPLEPLLATTSFITIECWQTASSLTLSLSPATKMTDSDWQFTGWWKYIALYCCFRTVYKNCALRYQFNFQLFSILYMLHISKSCQMCLPTLLILPLIIRSAYSISLPGGEGYFGNFWVGMCRWDPGTLSLYQN